MKGFNTGALHLIPFGKAKKRKPESFSDSVYNRHLRAAEIHQMSKLTDKHRGNAKERRGDGEREREKEGPTGRMRSGQRSYFQVLKATKLQQ